MNCLQQVTQKLKRKKKQALTSLSLSSQEMSQSYSPFSNEMSYLGNKLIYSKSTEAWTSQRHVFHLSQVILNTLFFLHERGRGEGRNRRAQNPSLTGMVFEGRCRDSIWFWLRSSKRSRHISRLTKCHKQKTSCYKICKQEFSMNGRVNNSFSKWLPVGLFLDFENRKSCCNHSVWFPASQAVGIWDKHKYLKHCLFHNYS